MTSKLVFRYAMCITFVGIVALIYFEHLLSVWHHPLSPRRITGRDGTAVGSPAARPAHLNILLVVADDLCPVFPNLQKPKTDFLIHPEMHTPNVVKMASRSLTLGQVYCQYSSCGPSHASPLPVVDQTQFASTTTR